MQSGETQGYSPPTQAASDLYTTAVLIRIVCADDDRGKIVIVGDDKILTNTKEESSRTYTLRG